MKISFDTNNLQVEWLGAEKAKQEVRGLSASGREARVFRAKNHVSCDRVAARWFFSYFFSAFFGFPHHCWFHINVGL